MIFNYSYHQKIYKILSSLNSELFIDSSAFFGGGTHITLNYDEYRWSKDIDFVCSSKSGYRHFREQIQYDNFEAIFQDTSNLDFPRTIKTDQYGIRFPVKIDEQIIKFEIFNESRISLGKPDFVEWLSVPCLNEIDCFAEKLLANTDRWRDSSIESRDLIDLCALRSHKEIPKESVSKAEEAYPVIDALKNSITFFQNDHDYRERCFQSLEIKNREHIINGLDLLASDHELPKTKRRNSEAGAEHKVHIKYISD